MFFPLHPNQETRKLQPGAASSRTGLLREAENSKTHATLPTNPITLVPLYITKHEIYMIYISSLVSPLLKSRLAHYLSEDPEDIREFDCWMNVFPFPILILVFGPQ